MTVEEEVQKEVARVRGTALSQGSPRDEEFAKIRAEVRGAIVRAWAALVPTGEWLQVDDRLVDIVDEWLKQKRGRTGDR